MSSFIARCPDCRVEIVSSTRVPCPLCDRKLFSRSLYVYGPASISTGGSVLPPEKRIKETCRKTQYLVTAEQCDICAAATLATHAFRIGRQHYAACDDCYSRLNLVRLRKTRFNWTNNF